MAVEGASKKLLPRSEGCLREATVMEEYLLYIPEETFGPQAT